MSGRVSASASWDFAAVCSRLAEAYGPLGWWPAESRCEILVGAVLVQNTAWGNVERALVGLKAAVALTPSAMLELDDAVLTAAIRPAGFFRVKAQRLQNLMRFVRDAGGIEALDDWPTDRLRAGLLGVSGVGFETADAIALYAFERPLFVVDAYARRLVTRVFGPDGPPRPTADYERFRQQAEAAMADSAAVSAADYQVAHAAIVEHAKRYCRARPACGPCILNRQCQFAAAAA